jgi:replicative DNA helicase Mcm
LRVGGVSVRLLGDGQGALFERIAEFLKSYREGGREKYRDAVRRMAVERRRSVEVSVGDLIVHDKGLADELLRDPRAFLEAASAALRKVLEVEDPEYARAVKRLSLRIADPPPSIVVPLRGLRSVHVGRLVAVEGVVTRVSPVKHEMAAAVYRCGSCGGEVKVELAGGELRRPEECPTCHATSKTARFTLLEEKSELVDVQKLVLQEKPEELPPGQLPRSIEVVVRDDLVDTVRPGDRVTVVGFLSLYEDKKVVRSAGGPAFRGYIEANNVVVHNREAEVVEITPEDEKKILELSRREDLEELIVNSIAPSIYGYREVKLAIALLLFGGVPKVYPDGVRVRGDIHVLLIGDPGTAKSQLLRYACSVAPRGVYTTGRGASAAGLTAAVVKDSGGEFVLEAGALVLADGGVACIDEFDKMSQQDRTAIHEAMEQQTVSIAKAGIVATLNARAAVLAAANPAFGRYIPSKTVAENIDLPPTILSRFDLIFVLRDIPSEREDAALADHVLGFHAEEAQPGEFLPPELLRKYIAYARAHVHPRLSQEARARIREFYVRMRGRSEGAGSPIAITPRQLEALIRLSEARARMHLRDVVTAEDAEAAIRLMEHFLRSVGVDTATRMIDIDVVMTGQPKSQREKIVMVYDIVKELVRSNSGNPVRVEDVVEEARARGLDEAFVRRVVEHLVERGELIQPRPGLVAPIAL